MGAGLPRALAIHRGVPSVYRGGTAFYHRSVLDRTDVFEFVAAEVIQCDTATAVDDRLGRERPWSHIVAVTCKVGIL